MVVFYVLMKMERSGRTQNRLTKKNDLFEKKFKKQKKILLLAHFFSKTQHTVRALCTTKTTDKNKSTNKMSSSSEEEEEDEEEDQREEESEEEEEEEDSDSEYRHSQDDDDGENFIREQNVKALRDGLPLSKIRYASVLSNLKPPEPDEVILKRHFAPLVPGGALQTGTFLVRLLVCFLLRAFGGGESILDF